MAKKQKFIGELLHFGAVRMRVTGSGDLKTIITSLDDVNESQLPNIALQSTTNKEPLILCNFREQRAYLEVYTEDIDAKFTISRIVVFVKPTATGYPQ